MIEDREDLSERSGSSHSVVRFMRRWPSLDALAWGNQTASISSLTIVTKVSASVSRHGIYPHREDGCQPEATEKESYVVAYFGAHNLNQRSCRTTSIKAFMMNEMT